MLARSLTAALGILVVGEAPNHADTYDPDKGYLTYDPDTDPTGKFMHSLLVDEAGLHDHEIADVLFTSRDGTGDRSQPLGSPPAGCGNQVDRCCGGRRHRGAQALPKLL